MPETLKTYRCQSRVMYGHAGDGNNLCRYSCLVRSEFEPRGCLYVVAAQICEEVENATDAMRPGGDGKQTNS